MVEEQLVRRGIQDLRLLSAMRKVPRHLFVEEALRERAYSDHALPIGEKQTISQPYMVGLMTEALGLTGAEKVLEIGAGSGYQTAVLAEMAGRVCAIERIDTLYNRAWAILSAFHYYNVVLHLSDGTRGWPDGAPYDAILVAAAAPAIPTPLIDQLKVGGRLVMPVGPGDAQRLQKVVKTDRGITQTSLIPCLFVPLLGEVV
jgi:protein-L-isoaspartate(D-aspartate) O-methyltransferase